MLSQTQENYLKCIYKLSEEITEGATTNTIAEVLKTKAASVTSMLKKLASKKLIHYEKYQAVSLTAKGKKEALSIIRNHRLWEYFLVHKLNFNWDEVHDLAEELEHVNSDLLIKRLDMFLGFPKFDPHGDPIPDPNGKIVHLKALPLCECKTGDSVIISGVCEHSTEFLTYLKEKGLTLGKKITIEQIIPFDSSMKLLLNKKTSLFVSYKITQNILVQWA